MRYVYKGQIVFFKHSDKWVPCVVEAAMGNTVRIVNPLLKIDTWADVSELREKKFE